MSKQDNGAGMPAGDASGHWFGVYPAQVCDVADPEGQGRVKVRLPWAPDAAGGPAPEVWARLATMAAGPGWGSWFVPDVGNEVLVAFQGGDPAWPVVLGSMWNGVNTPPSNSSPPTGRRILRSRSGARIEFNDAQGGEGLTLSTAGGHKVVLDDSAHRLSIIDREGNHVLMDYSGMTVRSVGKLVVEATEVTLTTAKFRINAAKVEVAGQLKADTVVTTSVVANAYTTGAGNIW